MKFIDGFWLLKQGIKPYYGLQVAQIKDNDTGYELQVATRPIRHRGDTLAGPVLRVKVHSPTEGVIGVKIDHFSTAGSYPNIELFPDAHAPASPNLSKSKTDSLKLLSSGGLTAEITENPYTVTFKAVGRTLTFAGYKYQGIYDVPNKWTALRASSASCLATDPSSNPTPEMAPEFVRYVHSELNLSPGELIYGFGEQFGAFIKNGQSIKIWNQDGGTSSEQAYKCVPFYMTNRGYGVFVNHPGEVEVEVGSEKVSRVGVSVADESLEYFIIYGETPLQILERYTRMTGRPALLPSWTFGLWLSTSFLTDYSSKTVSSFLEGMRQRDCPVRVFHLDCFWMKQYEWCSFTFDPENFPDPQAYLAEIKSKYNVKICLWINPYISQLSPIFKEGVEGGYFIKRKDGRPWQWDLWQPGLAVVDITNPAAASWYCGKLKALLDMGVDCFKTDFGERIPHTGVVFHNGSDPMRMHNSYAVLYNALVFGLTKDKLGEGQAVVFARASAAGGQRYPVHWGGDCESTFEAMNEALRGCLSLTLSGFGFASHDIGGFEGHPPPEIYQRWVAFGLFSSHSRLHGSASYRVPWIYGEEAAKSMSKFVEAKHRLMPYVYKLAVDAHVRGYPLQRAMFLEFLSDCTTHFLDRQFMLGPSLLVAPVFVPQEEEAEYYLPAGRWTSFWDSSRTIQGPVWVKERVALDDIPVWVRPGSALCLGPEKTGRPDYDFTSGVEVRLYQLQDGQTVSAAIPSQEGTKMAGTITATKRGDEIVVQTDGPLAVTQIQLVTASLCIKSVTGGAPTAINGGYALQIDAGCKEVLIKV